MLTKTFFCSSFFPFFLFSNKKRNKNVILTVSYELIEQRSTSIKYRLTHRHRSNSPHTHEQSNFESEFYKFTTFFHTQYFMNRHINYTHTCSHKQSKHIKKHAYWNIKEFAKILRFFSSFFICFGPSTYILKSDSIITSMYYSRMLLWI